MENPGLYVHIPFCRTRCGYCDFYSTTQTGLIPGYVEAVEREMGLYRDAFGAFDTIYFGGGTPSLLRPGQIEHLLARIRKTFVILPGSEITCEVNPADLNREDLKHLRGLGINRLTIGVQSFNDDELILLGRRHTRIQDRLPGRVRGRFRQHRPGPDLLPAGPELFAVGGQSEAGH